MPKDESKISVTFPIAQANTVASDVAISSPQMVLWTANLRALFLANYIPRAVSRSGSPASFHENLRTPDPTIHLATGELAKDSVAGEDSINDTSVWQCLQ